MDDDAIGNGTARAAEVVASLCMATDLAMGFPFEHGLESTLTAMRLCDVLGVAPDDAQRTYYISMLFYAGCTAESAHNAATFAGDHTRNVIPALFGSRAELITGMTRAMPPPSSGPLRRTIEIARRLPIAIGSAKENQTALCEVAEMLAHRLGLPAEIGGAFAFLTERWDGRGMLGRAEGEEIPLPMRIALVARDATFQRHVGGEAHARRTLIDRAGNALDPTIAGALAGDLVEAMTRSESEGSAWQEILEAEPGSPVWLAGSDIDDALLAIASFADLVSPSLSGHSVGVARLAASAALAAGFDDDEVTTIRRAGLVHDVGRVGVPAAIWDEPRPMTTDERERVRLHPYHTERVLARAPLLAGLGNVACFHHERMDGSGYHRGADARSLSPSSRLLSVADAFHAMTEPRPHRPALSSDQAVSELARETNEGRFDADMVEAVVHAAELPLPELERPAGLTRREVEVLGLIARGLQTKQVAHHLEMSPKTADTHIQNAYRKIGVSTRAAATVFAMEHGMVASGELPMYG